MLLMLIYACLFSREFFFPGNLNEYRQIKVKIAIRISQNLLLAPGSIYSTHRSLSVR